MKTIKSLISIMVLMSMLLSCFTAIAESSADIAVESLFGTDVEAAAEKFALNKTQAQSKDVEMAIYDNEDLLLGATDGKIVQIQTFGGNYTVFGVKHGMTKQEAEAVLDAQGIKYEEDSVVEINQPVLRFNVEGTEDVVCYINMDSDADNHVTDCMICTECDEHPADDSFVDDNDEAPEEAAPTKEPTSPKISKQTGYIRITGEVHLRKNADKSSKSLDTVLKGTKLKYSAVSKDSRGIAWYQVKVSGHTGWVSSKFAEKISKKEYEKKHPTPSRKAKGVIRLTGKVNVRKEPNRNSKSLRTFAKDSELSYTATAKDERGVLWYKVSCDGITGWISSKNAKKVPVVY